MDEHSLIETISCRIFQIRGKRVMLDKDLAVLYGVRPIALRQQVKRNIERFPQDFMFVLTGQEAKALVSQNVIPSVKSLGGYAPYVFTEQGVAMLSSILRSKQAVMMNIYIMRAFVSLRRVGITYVALKRKIEEMERMYDKNFSVVFQALKRLIEPPVKKKTQLDFM